MSVRVDSHTCRPRDAQPGADTLDPEGDGILVGKFFDWLGRFVRYICEWETNLKEPLVSIECTIKESHILYLCVVPFLSRYSCLPHIVANYVFGPLHELRQIIDIEENFLIARNLFHSEG